MSTNVTIHQWKLMLSTSEDSVCTRRHVSGDEFTKDENTISHANHHGTPQYNAVYYKKAKQRHFHNKAGIGQIQIIKCTPEEKR